MPLPIDLEKDIAVGISLPLQAGRGGYFNQTYTTIEQVTSNVINLLLTIPGERYMQPNFGSNLHKYLFEQYDSLAKQDIIESITEAMGIWLPYVNIVELEVKDPFEDEELKSSTPDYNNLNHTILVYLTISLSADPDTHLEITLRGDSSTGRVAVTTDTPFSGPGTDGDGNKSTKDVYDSVRPSIIPPKTY